MSAHDLSWSPRLQLSRFCQGFGCVVWPRWESAAGSKLGSWSSAVGWCEIPVRLHGAPLPAVMKRSQTWMKEWYLSSVSSSFDFDWVVPGHASSLLKGSCTWRLGLKFSGAGSWGRGCGRPRKRTIHTLSRNPQKYRSGAATTQQLTVKSTRGAQAYKVLLWTRNISLAATPRRACLRVIKPPKFPKPSSPKCALSSSPVHRSLTAVGH